MLVSYTIRGLTGDGLPIRGHAVIDSVPTPADQDGGLRFKVVAFEATADGDIMCSCGDEAGNIVFLSGPTPGVVLTGGADWKLGEWINGGTGAWFGHADGTRYPGPDSTFGDQPAYKILAPRIMLNTALVASGPFQPHLYLMLTMVPDGLVHLDGVLAPQAPTPGPPGNLSIR